MNLIILLLLLLDSFEGHLGPVIWNVKVELSLVNSVKSQLTNAAAESEKDELQWGGGDTGRPPVWSQSQTVVKLCQSWRIPALPSGSDWSSIQALPAGTEKENCVTVTIGWSEAGKSGVSLRDDAGMQIGALNWGDQTFSLLIWCYFYIIWTSM